ncbi:hypothetical protein AGR3A_Cc130018 [Agrobacterium tomkonis CFBP 6623]|uniref:Uncharacterized protein n=1 Tax=Agrobacterium tomkonis CFBP 6623 TaxID=1183432 RepID=A0A1S7NP04_9HYPH|nr:hypothetical protein AGR3A_Cc130018 [Agrobacterium tomkonis CFBP 6623]
MIQESLLFSTVSKAMLNGNHRSRCFEFALHATMTKDKSALMTLDRRALRCKSNIWNYKNGSKNSK